MQFGATMWFTEYSLLPSEFAVALEERGFESLWASEHSHLPVPKKPWELRDVQADVMAPFPDPDCGRNVHEEVGASARYEELGVTRCIVGLNPEMREAVLPILDRWETYPRGL